MKRKPTAISPKLGKLHGDALRRNVRDTRNQSYLPGVVGIKSKKEKNE